MSIIVAHRLATVRNDECGRHAELLAQGGLYTDLFRCQFYAPPEQKKTINPHSIEDL